LFLEKKTLKLDLRIVKGTKERGVTINECALYFVFSNH
jgi:hypothetical protein